MYRGNSAEKMSMRAWHSGYQKVSRTSTRQKDSVRTSMDVYLPELHFQLRPRREARCSVSHDAREGVHREHPARTAFARAAAEPPQGNRLIGQIRPWFSHSSSFGQL